jgi:hypothetical protein
MTRLKPKIDQNLSEKIRKDSGFVTIVQMRSPDFAALYPGYVRHARARRGHPRLYGVHQTKDVDGRNKSGHDGGQHT